MAVSAENLDVLLRVIGLRSFQGQMAEARASVAGVGKQAVQTDEKMAAAGATSMSLAKIGLGVAASLAVVAGEAYKSSVGYQQNIEMIHTQAGATQSEVAFMYHRVIQMARQFPQGPTEMAKGMYHLESVGMRGTQALDAMRNSAQLASIGNSNLEETTSAVAAAWRTGITGATNFRQEVAILNATVGAGNMRMDQLVAAMGTGVLPVFKGAGLTLKDFGASLALLTDEGQHADNAATHLRMAINLLAAPSKIAQKELKTIGLNSLDLGKTMQGPNGLINSIQLLKTHLYENFPTQSDADKASRLKILSRAFGGARSGATIIALVDQLDTLRKKYTQIGANQKQFGDDWKKTQETAAFKIHTAWSGLQADLIDLGDVIRGPATSAFVWLMGAAGVLVGGLEILAKHIKDVARVLGPLIGAWLLYKGVMIASAIATSAWEGLQLVATIIALIPEIGSLADAWTLLDIAMDANPIGVVILAIGALIAIVLLIIAHFKDVKRVAVDAWHWIEHAAEDAFSWIKGHWPLVLAILIGPFALLPYLVITHFNQIIGFLGSIGKKIGHVASKLWQPILDAFKWVVNQVIDAFNFLIHNFGLPGFHIGPFHFGGVHPFAHDSIPHLAEGGFMGSSGFAVINERAAGETVWLPGGSSVQPSPASSLALARSHVPNPTPAPQPAVFEHTTIVQLDRRTLYKAMTRAQADDSARRGS